MGCRAGSVARAQADRGPGHPRPAGGGLSGRHRVRHQPAARSCAVSHHDRLTAAATVGGYLQATIHRREPRPARADRHRCAPVNVLLTRRLLPWSTTVGLLVLWQLVCVVLRVDTFILPSPLEVSRSLVQNTGLIMVNALQTLMTTVAGFALGVAAGMALGLLLGTSRAVYDGLYPVMIGFNSIPKVAIVPGLVILFGIGTVPAILTAFVTAAFPIVVNVATGLATIEPEWQDVLRVLGARKWQILMKIGIPRALPYFFASLKVAITLAFVGSVVAETVAANAGIGFLMMTASGPFGVPPVCAGLVVVAATGIPTYEVFARLERRLTFWAIRSRDLVT